MVSYSNLDATDPYIFLHKLTNKYIVWQLSEEAPRMVCWKKTLLNRAKGAEVCVSGDKNRNVLEPARVKITRSKSVASLGTVSERNNDWSGDGLDPDVSNKRFKFSPGCLSDTLKRNSLTGYQYSRRRIRHYAVTGGGINDSLGSRSSVLFLNRSAYLPTVCKIPTKLACATRNLRTLIMSTRNRRSHLAGAIAWRIRSVLCSWCACLHP